jgi:hypothetical protein
VLATRIDDIWDQNAPEELPRDEAGVEVLDTAPDAALEMGIELDDMAASSNVEKGIELARSARGVCDERTEDRSSGRSASYSPRSETEGHMTAVRA